MAADQKQAALNKIRLEYDQHANVLELLKDDKVFGDSWKAFEASQLTEDVNRREEIMGRVTTELINGIKNGKPASPNPNPSEKQINEAAMIAWRMEEINKSYESNKRTKLGKNFNNYQEQEDAVVGITSLFENNLIEDQVDIIIDGVRYNRQYSEIISGINNGSINGATISLKNGDTHVFQVVRNAAMSGRTETQVHEHGHEIVMEALGNNSEVEALVAEQLIKFVENKNPALSILFESRIEKNKDGSLKTSEVIPNFLEMVAEGKIDFNEKSNWGLGSLIGNLL